MKDCCTKCANGSYQNKNTSVCYHKCHSAPLSQTEMKDESLKNFIVKGGLNASEALGRSLRQTEKFGTLRPHKDILSKQATQTDREPIKDLVDRALKSVEENGFIVGHLTEREVSRSNRQEILDSCLTEKECCDNCTRAKEIVPNLNCNNCPCHTQRSDWRERFDAQEFHSLMIEDCEYHEDKIKAFIEAERENVRREVLQEAINLANKLETGDTEFNEWRAFKHYRNTLRDLLDRLK